MNTNILVLFNIIWTTCLFARWLKTALLFFGASAFFERGKKINVLFVRWAFQLVGNVFVYGKLRVCGRGFSEGKSEASKQATTFVLAKTSNFLYTVLYLVFFYFYNSDYFCQFFQSVS